MKQFKLTIIILLMSLIITSCSGNEIQEKYLSYKGNKTYYEIRGNSPGVLLFIHGWTGSTKSWKYQLDAFNDYKVIALDLPGNGRSSKNEKASYNMELFADTIHELLKKENIKCAFFIGHSMGFAVAEIIAVKYPDICKGIASIDGAHFELPENPKEKKEWIKFNREFAKSLDNEKGREDFINALFLPDTPKLLREEVFKISRQVPLAIGKSMIEGAEKDQKYWSKRTMNIPCLAIYSPAYKLTPAYKTDFKKMYPKVEYHEVTDVSHFFMLEIPYKVNQIITDYLLRENL